ncbi:hypothetical protein [Kangiella sp. TOML190]|uniref:hypothetical protein n=1 Tax=Kangiella sp. TOML190 TaxID=2931351 RepID=UPI0020418DDD|nr:hypothetical protein [Kangiella sp. TOML190]
MKKTLLIVLILLIQGCSSIPLSTMWKMRNFDENSFTQIEPRYIRMKVRTDKPMDVDNDSIKLKFGFEGKTEKQEEILGLELIATDKKNISHFFSDDTQEYSYTFRLKPESIMAMQKVQRSPLVHKKKREGKASFSASWNFGEKTPTQYTISIDLQLDPTNGYFTLIDEYYFDFDKLQKES